MPRRGPKGPPVIAASKKSLLTGIQICGNQTCRVSKNGNSRHRLSVVLVAVAASTAKSQRNTPEAVIGFVLWDEPGNKWDKSDLH
jgi:hypothetical protein